MAGIGNPDTWSLGQQDTVIAALERAVAKHPDRVLLDFSGEFHTYGEVDRQSTRLAHSFAALGVQAGQTVVTMLDNNVDAVLCWFAINKLCAVSVPINTAPQGRISAPPDRRCRSSIGGLRSELRRTHRGGLGWAAGREAGADPG